MAEGLPVQELRSEDLNFETSLPAAIAAGNLPPTDRNLPVKQGSLNISLQASSPF